LYFHAPQGVEISNSNRRLPDGIDVRAGEAYAIAPPSRHESGQIYVWQPGRAPWDVELRPLPDALLSLLVIKQEPFSSSHSPEPSMTARQAEPGRRSRYVAKALRDELDRLAQAEVGHRNDLLNLSAFSLGQFIEAGLLPRGEVEALLHNAAIAIGLGELEIRRTIKSGIEAGMRSPRRVWPDLS